jgi:hypothetical protein
MAFLGSAMNDGFRAPVRAANWQRWADALDPPLLDLGFLEGDVLARDWVVFLERKLVGRGSRVLFGDVKEARACRAQQLDFLSDRLRHEIGLFLSASELARTLTPACC